MTARKAVKKATPKAKVKPPVPKEVKQEEWTREEVHVQIMAGQKAAAEQRVQQYRAEVGAICTEMAQNRMRLDFLEKSAAVASGKLEEAEASCRQLAELERQAASKP